MKKCLVVIMLLAMTAGIVFAGLGAEPHIQINRVGKISGGNSQTLIQASNEYSQEEAKINRLSQAGPKESMTKPLYNRYRIFGTGASVIISLEGKASSKPVAKNSVPTKANGLINANAPIVIEALRDTISFGLSPSISELKFSIRILDAKGKVVDSAKFDKARNIKFADVKVTEKPQKYYVEFSDGKKYYYVLFQISNPKNGISQAEYKEVKAVVDDYLRKHNIASYNDITEEDEGNIVEALTEHDKNKRLAELDDDVADFVRKFDDEDYDPNESELVSFQVEQFKKMPQTKSAMDRYMKKHNIKSYKNLTQKDMEAISDELMKSFNQ